MVKSGSTFGFILILLMVFSCDHYLEVQPAVLTGEVDSVAVKDAIVNGSIIDLGKGVNDHGHCYGTSPGPGIKGEKSSLGEAEQVYLYSSQLKNLNPNETYYVRAYLISGDKTYYGIDVSFTTLDGNVEITTDEITESGANSAKCRSTVSSNGGYELEGRGVLWNTNASLSLNSFTGINQGDLVMGEVESLISNLKLSTIYYVRAYAYTKVDTAYGDILVFTTKDGVVVFDAISTSNITSQSVICQTSISDDGGSPITARGICYGTSLFPTRYGNHIINGEGTGGFSIEILGLSENTIYYIRAFATNGIDTYYGEQVSIKTESSK